MGLAPHRAAKDASLASRSGLSPMVMSSAAALSGPTPTRCSSLGACAAMTAVIRASRSRISVVRCWMRPASSRRV